MTEVQYVPLDDRGLVAQRVFDTAGAFLKGKDVAAVLVLVTTATEVTEAKQTYSTQVFECGRSLMSLYAAADYTEAGCERVVGQMVKGDHSAKMLWKRWRGTFHDIKYYCRRLAESMLGEEALR